MDVIVTVLQFAIAAALVWFGWSAFHQHRAQQRADRQAATAGDPPPSAPGDAETVLREGPATDFEQFLVGRLTLTTRRLSYTGSGFFRHPFDLPLGDILRVQATFGLPIPGPNSILITTRQGRRYRLQVNDRKAWVSAIARATAALPPAAESVPEPAPAAAAEAPATLTATCPQCGISGPVPATAAGRQVTCRCGTSFLIPAPAASAEEAPGATAEAAAPVSTSGDVTGAGRPPLPGTPTWRTPWALGLAGLGVLLFIGLSLHNIGDARTGGGGLFSKPVSFGAYAAEAKAASYEDLARNYERLSGETVVFSGKVQQVIKDEKGAQELLVAMSYGDDGPRDMLYVTYERGDNSTRVLEDDEVKFWGTVEGQVKVPMTDGSTDTFTEVRARFARLTTAETVSPLDTQISYGGLTIALTEMRRFDREPGRYGVCAADDCEFVTVALRLTNLSGGRMRVSDAVIDQETLMDPVGNPYHLTLDCQLVTVGGKSLGGAMSGYYILSAGETVDCTVTFADVPFAGRPTTLRLAGRSDNRTGIPPPVEIPLPE